MNTLSDGTIDVMQVCRNGHVITDLLRSCPERGLSHCDRCGAGTFERCLTCGQPLQGAVFVPGLLPVGVLRPPSFCATCGAAFPWTDLPAPSSKSSSLSPLEPMLRRVPAVVRQLRSRHGTRPPFRIDDAHDLEDLVRALLALHVDDVRPENRTPAYAADTRIDFLLDAGSAALVVKRAAADRRDNRLAEEWTEDVAYYRRRRGCRTLLGFIYDPEALLVGPRELEKAWVPPADDLEVRCVIAQ